MTLIRGAVDAAPVARVLEPGGGRRLAVLDLPTRVLLPSEDAGRRLALLEHTLSPGVLGAPPHLHTREDEISFVLEGELVVRFGEDEPLRAPEGSMVVKPRDVWHTFWAGGDRPVRFLEIITPAGFEAFFEDLLDLPTDPEALTEALPALGEAYGLRFDLAAVPALLAEHGLRL